MEQYINIQFLYNQNFNEIHGELIHVSRTNKSISYKFYTNSGYFPKSMQNLGKGYIKIKLKNTEKLHKYWRIDILNYTNNIFELVIFYNSMDLLLNRK